MARIRIPAAQRPTTGVPAAKSDAMCWVALPNTVSAVMFLPAGAWIEAPGSSLLRRNARSAPLGAEQDDGRAGRQGQCLHGAAFSPSEPGSTIIAK